MENRRQGLRVQLTTQVKGNGFRATLLDLSSTGARIVLPKNFEHVQLDFIHNGRRYNLFAEVVWSQKLGNSQTVVCGLAFRPSGEQAKALRNLVVLKHYGLRAA